MILTAGHLSWALWDMSKFIQWNRMNPFLSILHSGRFKVKFSHVIS